MKVDSEPKVTATAKLVRIGTGASQNSASMGRGCWPAKEGATRRALAMAAMHSTTMAQTIRKGSWPPWPTT